MDGRGRWMDNVFIERLWRSMKYEDIYLKGYADGREAARGIAEWIAFYNERRPHQALTDRAPMAVWREAIAGAEAVDMMDDAPTLPTCPQAAKADAASCCVTERNDEQPRLPTKKPTKRSRCAGPFHHDENPRRRQAENPLNRLSNSRSHLCLPPLTPSNPSPAAFPRPP